jgi:hypothetical protein
VFERNAFAERIVANTNTRIKDNFAFMFKLVFEFQTYGKNYNKTAKA